MAQINEGKKRFIYPFNQLRSKIGQGEIYCRNFHNLDKNSAFFISKLFVCEDDFNGKGSTLRFEPALYFEECYSKPSNFVLVGNFQLCL